MRTEKWLIVVLVAGCAACIVVGLGVCYFAVGRAVERTRLALEQGPEYPPPTEEEKQLAMPEELPESFIEAAIKAKGR